MLEKSEAQSMTLAGLITIPELNDPFIAKKNFVQDISKRASVRLALSETFRCCFLDGKGLTESPCGALDYHYVDLEKLLGDEQIVSLLGPINRITVRLWGIHQLMRFEPSLQLAALRKFNVFYVKDQLGIIRAVRLQVTHHSYRLRSFRFGGEYGWEKGVRIFFIKQE